MKMQRKTQVTCCALNVGYEVHEELVLVPVCEMAFDEQASQHQDEGIHLSFVMELVGCTSEFEKFGKVS